ncbi:hypothetical protein ILUMI_13125 [Ignelater luminosus]|uniref:Uncharacterized protein n=1 Tax=Ignelater luminosus TaxID=2038154 RepID=A0A8K0G646_IGNLU|nr:hypothetical protein ILUMI_13125 [Ignelater luminosus]
MFVFLAFLVATCVLQAHSVPVPTIQSANSFSGSGLTQQDLDRARAIQDAYRNDPKPFDTSNWKPTEQNWLKPSCYPNSEIIVDVNVGLQPVLFGRPPVARI